MNDDKILSLVRKFAKNNSEIDDIHGFVHVERVYNLCLQIGKHLDANLFILKLASLLHDIGRIYEITDPLKRNHAEISAEMAHDFLKSNFSNLSQETFTYIIHCIKAHSFSNKIYPKTLEAKILSDADKLDALGAIGLYRTIGFAAKNQGGINQVIDHLESKILKLKSQMYLEYSKKLATEKENIIFEFYNKIMKEK